MTRDRTSVNGAALLVNARPDKGFDFILGVAALVPAIPFIAVASQSPLEEAQQAVKSAGLNNVEVIPKVDDIDKLYDQARVVLVPSYQFVETFSRVCIEAHRRGLPVIGSDVGNVPNLLRTSGISLPEDANAWAEELSRLFSDDVHYTSRRAAAFDNSDVYSRDNQKLALQGVLNASVGSFLMGVGSGIGNMLHVTPTIRNIARHLGHKIDVVIAEDHVNSLFLLHNSTYVNAVYSLSSAVRHKRYETVFLTNCFGPAPVSFNAERLIRSRDWSRFVPGQSVHETVFNLKAAKELLGVSYEETDVLAHYVGDVEYVPPSSGLVGMHGGSKGGYWSSKRWPYFARLSDELKARGFRVASFGTADEYIPGTEDYTGGSIQQMTESLRGCDYMVSNDSGVMNIAAALGIPTLGIFGPTDPLTRAPQAPQHHYVAYHRGSGPCEITAESAFRAGLCTCIDEVPMEQVLGGFNELLERSAGGTPLEKRTE